MILWKQFVAKVILAMLFVALNTNAAAVEPWSEYSITEIQQSNNYYNYIKNIQPAVDKYYPQYSAYFKNVLAKFNDYGTAEKYIINKWINRTLSSYSWSISTDRDRTTTALVVLDYLEWESKFVKDPNIIKKNQDWTENRKIKAANAILKGIKREYDWILKDLKKIEKELGNISNLIDSWINENDTKNIIDYSEKYMEKYKEYFIDAGIIKESSELQNLIKWYVKILNITWKGASEVGKIYIDEYNRIIKK